MNPFQAVVVVADMWATGLQSARTTRPRHPGGLARRPGDTQQAWGGQDELLQLRLSDQRSHQRITSLSVALVTWLQTGPVHTAAVILANHLPVDRPLPDSQTAVGHSKQPGPSGLGPARPPASCWFGPWDAPVSPGNENVSSM
ncbi:unnamed protein product [Gadus morhua 'NCC']